MDTRSGAAHPCLPRTERCVQGREIGANTDKIPGKWGRGGHPTLSLWFERVPCEPHWRGHLGESLYIHMSRGSVLGQSESRRKQLPVPSLDGGDLRAGFGSLQHTDPDTARLHSVCVLSGARQPLVSASASACPFTASLLTGRGHNSQRHHTLPTLKGRRREQLPPSRPQAPPISIFPRSPRRTVP